VLVLDDETPALDELSWVLRQDPRIADVYATDSPTEALRVLKERDIDAVFLDIQMPGLDGIELASVLARFKHAPAVVFVTAHEKHAVEAFELEAVDYVLKPVRQDRIGEAIRRVLGGSRTDTAVDQVPVERGGVTRFVPVSEIRYVEAEGDYARLHTAAGSHLVRIPLSQLEQQWASSGFVRIHRSLLVSLTYVEELRVDSGRCSVVVGGPGARVELAVSRRHTRQLRDLLVRDTRRGGES
jgi:DNA-binding LytR/AlgR family response regulator